MSNLLPVLKNRQEFELQKGRGMFVDELFGNEHSPILMYGEDKGEYMSYSPSKNEEEDRLVKEQAIKNLEDLDIPYQIQETQGFRVAMVQHEYAAEKILDVGYMKKIATDLGSNAIVVGIPMKGFLAAVAKGQGEANLFGAIVNQYNNAQTYPISDALYFLVDGKIEMMGNHNKSATAPDENGVFDIAGKNDAKGKLGFVAKVGHQNEDELGNQIQTAFQNILLQGMKAAGSFNGKIDFHISPDFNQLTPSLEERIKKMAKNISERGAVQIMGGLSGEPFKVRFFYGEDQLIAETIETEPVQMTASAGKQEKAEGAKAATASKAAKKPWWKFW